MNNPHLWQQRQIAIVPLLCSPEDDIPEYYVKDIISSLINLDCSVIMCGEIGLMPHIAQALKRNGIPMLLIRSEDSITLEDYSAYDMVVSGGKTNNDVIIAANKSCAGILGIPSSHPSAFQISEDNGIPIITICHNNRKIGSFPSYASADKAIQEIIIRYSYMNNIDAIKHFNDGLELQKQNYPLKDKGEYLRASRSFHAASLAWLADNKEASEYARALYHGSIGDHKYYHVQAYFESTQEYANAMHIINNLNNSGQFEINEINAFWEAVAFESIAIALSKIGDSAMAQSMALQSAHRYLHASFYASDETRSCYEHTVCGLMGWADYLRAKMEYEKGNSSAAKSYLFSAKKQYEKALFLQPQWALSGFSDHYDNTLNEIRSLENNILRTERACL